MKTNEKCVCLVLAEYMPNAPRLYEAPAYSVKPEMIVETESGAGVWVKNAITINADLFPDELKFIIDCSREELPLKKVTAIVSREPLPASSFDWPKFGKKKEKKQEANDEH